MKQRWQWLVTIVALVLLSQMWRMAQARQQLPSGHPAQRQVLEIVEAMRASEASHVAGAYVPGVGAVVTIELLRGPNTHSDLPPDRAVREWTLYLMREFATQLDAVPATETIAFSVQFYDFNARRYHQLVISVKAVQIADPATFTIWLDGEAFALAPHRTLAVASLPLYRPAFQVKFV